MADDVLSICDLCSRLVRHFCVHCGVTPSPQPAGMIPIPAGTFMLGSSREERAVLTLRLKNQLPGNAFESERLQPVVRSRSVYMDQYPVTVRQFAEFAKNLSVSQRNALRIGDPSALADDRDLPATGVTWAAASKYAESQGKRLPTEAEWEIAAGWNPEKNLKQFFPWGNDLDIDRQRCAIAGHLEPVTSYELMSKSPLGCCDMVGNAAEWCADAYQGTYRFREHHDIAADRSKSVV